MAFTERYYKQLEETGFLEFEITDFDELKSPDKLFNSGAFQVMMNRRLEFWQKCLDKNMPDPNIYLLIHQYYNTHRTAIDLLRDEAHLLSKERRVVERKLLRKQGREQEEAAFRKRVANKKLQDEEFWRRRHNS